MDSLFVLLQRAAARWGDRTSLQFADHSLSYRQLLDDADRHASLFARYGAAPGCRVAFCFQKSIEAITALFGLIRTGATYVPLDPAWPAERMSLVCRDAGIALWVGTNPPVGINGITTAIAMNAGGGGAVALAAASAEPPAPGAPHPPKDGVANILYTSGSTGRPKGVEITTRSLVHFSQWAADGFGLTADDRLANHAPYNFDLSTLDIFAGVRAGATMVPVPERIKMFPYQMARFIAEQRISVWYSVPSALIMMQLRGKLGDHDLSRLRHVIFAGEVMPKPALQALARELPGRTWTNLYGPTETNVCTWHRVGPEELASEEPVPIGRPISDTRLWIVEDEGGRPRLVGNGSANQEASPGLTGELLVAGPTVTSGYFGDAELTSRRLVPAPDGEGSAYRTGDRVSVRADGVLMFLGRADRMIKRGGHRIEPGEIEAALARHPSVKEAAVVPLADPVFGSRLKACVAPREGHASNETELIAFCREHLPAYMMPDVWAFYPSLPRTDREKVDLQALQR